MSRASTHSRLARRGHRALERFVGLVCVACLSGCGDEAQRANAPGMSELWVEADQLQSSLRGGVLLSVLAVVAVAALVIGASSKLIEVLWRLGFDSRRRLSGVRAVVRAVVAFVAVWTIVRWLLLAAPILTAVGGTLLLAVLVNVMAPKVQSAYVGLQLAFSRALVEGNRIAIGAEEGVVRSVGLTEIRLRRSDGSTAVIPNRSLLREALHIAPSRNTVPVEVLFEVPSIDADVIEQARRAALLVPLRSTDSKVVVERSSTHMGFVRVEIQALSEKTAPFAKRQLESGLAGLPTARARRAAAPRP